MSQKNGETLSQRLTLGELIKCKIKKIKKFKQIKQSLKYLLSFTHISMR